MSRFPARLQLNYSYNQQKHVVVPRRRLVGSSCQLQTGQDHVDGQSRTVIATGRQYPDLSVLAQRHDEGLTLFYRLLGADPSDDESHPPDFDGFDPDYIRRRRRTWFREEQISTDEDEPMENLKPQTNRRVQQLARRPAEPTRAASRSPSISKKPKEPQSKSVTKLSKSATAKDKPTKPAALKQRTNLRSMASPVATAATVEVKADADEVEEPDSIRPSANKKKKSNQPQPSKQKSKKTKTKKEPVAAVEVPEPVLKDVEPLSTPVATKTSKATKAKSKSAVKQRSAKKIPKPLTKPTRSSPRKAAGTSTADVEASPHFPDRPASISSVSSAELAFSDDGGLPSVNSVASNHELANITAATAVTDQPPLTSKSSTLRNSISQTPASPTASNSSNDRSASLRKKVIKRNAASKLVEKMASQSKSGLDVVETYPTKISKLLRKRLGEEFGSNEPKPSASTIDPKPQSSPSVGIQANISAPVAIAPSTPSPSRTGTSFLTYIDDDGAESDGTKKKTSILRKARLQFNQKTVAQLREPSSLQELVFNDDENQKAAIALAAQSSPLLQVNLDSPTVSKFSVAQPQQISSKPSTKKSPKKKGQKSSPEKKQPPEPPKVLSDEESPTKSKSSRPGSITCAICGITKFYSHKQRRHGQFSCESCSKFFGRFLRNPKVYYCEKNGDCPITAAEESTSQAIQQRCRACWLKVCLQKFTIESNVRSSISDFAPKLNSSPNVALITVDTTTQCESDTDSEPEPPRKVRKSDALLMVATGDEPQSARPLHAVNNTPRSSRIAALEARRQQATAGVATESKKQTAASRRHGQQPAEVITSPPTATGKRQGPRVKRVCRSAEVIKGLPRATFGGDSKSTSKSSRKSPAKRTPAASSKLRSRRTKQQPIINDAENSGSESRTDIEDGGADSDHSEANSDDIPIDVYIHRAHEREAKENRTQATEQQQAAGGIDPARTSETLAAGSKRPGSRSRKAPATPSQPPGNQQPGYPQIPIPPPYQGPPLTVQQQLQQAIYTPIITSKSEALNTSRTPPKKRKLRLESPTGAGSSDQAPPAQQLLVPPITLQASATPAFDSQQPQATRGHFSVNYLVSQTAQATSDIATLPSTSFSSAPTASGSSSGGISKPPKKRIAQKRCGTCSGCTADDCGQCVFCKDKKKFGGPNTIKQACKERRCLAPSAGGDRTPVHQAPSTPSVKPSMGGSGLLGADKKRTTSGAQKSTPTKLIITNESVKKKQKPARKVEQSKQLKQPTEQKTEKRSRRANGQKQQKQEQKKSTPSKKSAAKRTTATHLSSSSSSSSSSGSDSGSSSGSSSSSSSDSSTEDEDIDQVSVSYLLSAGNSGHGKPALAGAGNRFAAAANVSAMVLEARRLAPSKIRVED